MAGALALSTSSLAHASSESVLHSLPLGSHPLGQVQEDSFGSLYGTAYVEHRYGTVFQLKEHRGNWRARTIHKFGGRGDDGQNPYAGLTPDRDETTFYGTTRRGGVYGDGTVFSLVQSGDDGAVPVGLRFDRQTGAIYGTTKYGGAFGQGVVFKLTNLGGSWSESVLHSFSGGSDGANPQSRPAIDPQTGVLYGTTYWGGTHNGGTVYSVTP